MKKKTKFFTVTKNQKKNKNIDKKPAWGSPNKSTDHHFKTNSSSKTFSSHHDHFIHLLNKNNVPTPKHYKTKHTLTHHKSLPKLRRKKIIPTSNFKKQVTKTTKHHHYHSKSSLTSKKFKTSF